MEYSHIESANLAFENLDFENTISEAPKYPSYYRKTIRGIKHAFYKLDKYRRPMFYVQHEELEQLFNDCHREIDGEYGTDYESIQTISLMKDSKGTLILILSNSNQHERSIPEVECVMYKGALRFYKPKVIEWSN